MYFTSFTQKSWKYLKYKSFISKINLKSEAFILQKKKFSSKSEKHYILYFTSRPQTAQRWIIIIIKYKTLLCHYILTDH